MALMSLRKKSDNDLTAKYDSSTDMVIFFFNGEEIIRRTMEECEKIYPQYVWGQVKEKINEYITFTL